MLSKVEDIQRMLPIIFLESISLKHYQQFLPFFFEKRVNYAESKETQSQIEKVH